MSTNNTKINKKAYPIVEMPEKGKLRLSPDVISQIQFLHASVGNTEWSGMLVYDVVKGSPKDPKNFILEAKHIFLMDIGTAAYTEYSPDEDIIDLYDNLPEAMEMKTGHVHTHHTMNAFFSGTDTGELHDNVDKYNYYLSLIVNFSGNYVAKVAFLSDIERSEKMSYKDDSGTRRVFTTKKKEKAMVVINMEILWTGLPNFFVDRIPELRKKEAAIKKAKEQKNKQHHSYKNYQKGIYRDSQYSIGFKDDYYDNRITPIPDKMTDNELEKLARNIISVNPELTEVRPIYSVLHVLAVNDKDDDLPFFYDFLSKNVESVIENFFDKELDAEETGMVIDEVIIAINRYSGNFQLKSIVEGIVEVLEDYVTYKVEADDDDNDLDQQDILAIEQSLNNK